MPCADAALFPFWQQLTQPQKDRLFQEVREVHYARHAPVRAAGDSCLGILYVKTGGLRLSLLSEDRPAGGRAGVRAERLVRVERRDI